VTGGGERGLISLFYNAPANHLSDVWDLVGRRSWQFTYRQMWDPPGMRNAANRYYLETSTGPYNLDVAGALPETVTTTYSYYGFDIPPGPTARTNADKARLRGLLYQVKQTMASGQVGGVRTYDYYTNRRVFSVTDQIVPSGDPSDPRFGRRSYASYDTFHHATSTLDPDGRPTTTLYTPDGRLIETRTGDGARSRQTWAGLDDVGVLQAGVFRLNMDQVSGFHDGKDLMRGFYPTPGDTVLEEWPIAGDWNGDGRVELGIFRSHASAWSWLYLDLNGNNQWDGSGVDWGTPYGANYDRPLVWDFNKDGFDDVALYHTTGAATGDFQYNQFNFDAAGNRSIGILPSIHSGAAGTDQPVLGDWDGDGTPNIGVYRAGSFLLDGQRMWNAPSVPAPNNSLSDEIADTSYGYFAFGAAGAIPITGYFNTDTKTDVGTYNPATGTFTLDRTGDRLSGNRDDPKIEFGSPGNKPVTGNFDRDGAVGLLEQTTDELGRTERFSYDKYRNIVHQVGKDGLVTDTTYTAMGSPAPYYERVGTVTVQGRGGTPTPRVTSFFYNTANGDLLKTQDAMGNWTVMEYASPSRGLVMATTRPRGVDAAGNIVNTQYTTRYAYWPNYNPVDQNNPAPTTSLVTVEKVGTAPQLSWTEKGYDVRGYLTYTWDKTFTDEGVQRITNYQTNMVGQLKQMTVPDPDGSLTTLGALTSTYTYQMGQLYQATQPRGDGTQTRVTTYLYDLMGRLQQEFLPDVNQPNGSVAVKSWAYDGGGHVIASSVQDSVGALGAETPRLLTTRNFFDARGRLVQTIYPDNTIALIRYDSSGRKVATTDALGRVTTTTYDALDRKTAETLPDPDGTAGALPAPKTTFYYDDSGLVRETGPADTTFYTRDRMGRVTRTVRTGRTFTDVPTPTLYDNGVAGDEVSSTTYDADGNVTSQTRYLTETMTAGQFADLTTVPAALKRTIDYQYDALDRKQTELQPDPGGGVRPTTGYTYDDASNLLTTTDPRGFVTANRYDSHNRLVATGHDERLASTVVASGSTAVTVNLANHNFAVGDRVLVRDTPWAAANGVFAVTGVATGSFTYNATAAVSGSGTTAKVSNSVTSTGYDAAGLPWITIDPRGNRTDVAYDERGNKQQQLDPAVDGVRAATTSYSSHTGMVQQVTDPLNNVTTYQYDLMNRKVRQ
jgi:YD repeat-containing protein